MPHKQIFSLLVALCLSLGLSGCSATSHTVGFSQSELQRIPASSLQRMVRERAADEVVALRVAGRDEPVEVKAFKSKDTATVHTADAGEAEIRFADISELLIFRIPLPAQTDSSKQGIASSGTSSAGEALIYAPLIPLALTRPLFRAVGLDGQKNEDDNSKARRVYQGMSRKDLLESVGEPSEKYACLLNLHNKPAIPQQIWVYPDEKVLRGGRTLTLDLATETVSHNSMHTSYFKNSKSYSCSPLSVP